MPRRLTRAELLRRLDIIAVRRGQARRRRLDSPPGPHHTEVRFDELPPPPEDR